MDQAQSLGLAVAVDIPLPKFKDASFYYEEDERFNEIRKSIIRTVRTHRDHPALLYWTLGNELYYPYFYKSTVGHERFSELIDIMHKLDPNHPVTTTTIGANKLRVISIETQSPQLDFISFNSFGTLSKFSKKLAPISPYWDGPHAITEWGVNGPWEAEKTSWNASIEETSTKKAEQVRKRFRSYIEPIKTEGSLGSFIFYWGKKNEITPSWYSLFGENKLKTQAVYEMENIWKGEKNEFPGPELDYVLLNGDGAPENIVLSPKREYEAELVLPVNKKQRLQVTWEVRKESWYYSHKSEVVKGIRFLKDGNKVKFNTPGKEGPYRLYVYLTNDTEYYATANIPFYVLNPGNEK